jgi:hypothetical protein
MYRKFGSELVSCTLVTRQKAWVVDADWLRPGVDTSQDTDRQKVDLLSAGVRWDDLYVD